MSGWERELITESVRAASLRVMGGRFSPALIHKITALTVEGVVDLVIHKQQSKVFLAVMTDFQVFVLMCRLLAEIEKEIPAVAQVDMRCAMVTRDELMNCIASKGAVGEAD